MGLSNSEQRAWNRIKEWEKNLYEYQPTDLETTIDKWLERSFERLQPEMRERFFKNVDGWLFHIHGLLQGSQSQLETRERIINDARIFDENIQSLADMKELSIDQLIYLAEKQTTKYRLLSFAQGGLSGSGDLVLTGVDIPALTVINLRAVQFIATSYGFDVRTPYETMISLKLFHLATLPRRLQAIAWGQLVREIKENGSSVYFYEGDERLTDETWVKQPLKQLLKTILIVSLRKKAVQGLPLFSIAIGAGMNYRLTKTITEFAQNFYQLRVLIDKKKGAENS